MDSGLTNEEIEMLCFIFSKHLNIDEVILYGSRAKGNYQKGSDVDLTLVGENISLSEQLDIENEIEATSLPYLVDISNYHKIENSELIDHINRVGVTFYKKQQPNKQKQRIN